MNKRHCVDVMCSHMNMTLQNGFEYNFLLRHFCCVCVCVCLFASISLCACVWEFSDAHSHDIKHICRCCCRRGWCVCSQVPLVSIVCVYDSFVSLSSSIVVYIAVKQCSRLPRSRFLFIHTAKQNDSLVYFSVSPVLVPALSFRLSPFICHRRE